MLTIFLQLSATHVIIVAIIILLMFGGKKIPELMKGLGSGIKEFKDAVKEEDKNPSEKNTNTENNS
jgi:sec-independent protein translocase protein TatA